MNEAYGLWRNERCNGCYGMCSIHHMSCVVSLSLYTLQDTGGGGRSRHQMQRQWVTFIRPSAIQSGHVYVQSLGECSVEEVQSTVMTVSGLSVTVIVTVIIVTNTNCKFSLILCMVTHTPKITCDQCHFILSRPALNTMTHDTMTSD